MFIDQVHYRGVDAGGQPTGVNPNYLKPVLYQPPAAFRFGVEVDW